MTFNAIRTFPSVPGLDEQVAHMVANQNTGAGAQGVPGPQGPIGPTGATGATGATGGNVFAGCLLYKDANESIASGVDEALLWNLEAYDVGGFHSTTSNTDRITIPSTYNNYYGVFKMQIYFDSVAAGGRRLAYVFKGGSGFVGYPYVQSECSSGEIRIMVATSAPILLATDDYFQCFVGQSNGSALALNVLSSGTNATWFSLQIIGT